MSTTVVLSTYFAVEAPVSTFFFDTRKREHICSSGNLSHTVSATANFCEQCGKPIVAKAIMEPTEVFRAFCVKVEATPEQAFEMLREGDWEWSDDKGSKHSLGWYKVCYSINPLGEDSSDGLMALGIKLEERFIHGEESSSEAISYIADDLTTLTEVLKEVVEEFKLTTTPKLYVQAYRS